MRILALGAVLALLGGGLDAFASDPVSYSPKLTIRTSVGSLQNTGTLGGSTLTFGTLDFAYLYFLSPVIELGVGYHLDLDFGSGQAPFSGFNLNGRYYFKGQGTVVHSDSGFVASDTHDTLAYYAGLELAQRSYNQFEAGNLTQPISGSFVSLNGLLGTDFRITRSVELTAEAGMGFMSFASDERIKIQATVLQFGVNYVW